MMISEVFRSLQGEGMRQGRPCTFIRCAGCNLSCGWCDTPYAQKGGTGMSVEEVLEQVDTYGSAYVCITGGEPLLQREDVLLLARALHQKGILVDIETNGTRDFSALQPYAAICMDVKCPSSGEESDLSLLRKLTFQDAVKFVVQGEEDCQYLTSILSSYPMQGEVFVFPVYGTNYRYVADYVLENDLPVRFQVQLHRFLEIR
ncbi:MAG: radical SAM protein [Methanomicrobiales archaeon]|nr:radical SAM protein [Methanomicrobiales archaeon]